MWDQGGQPWPQWPLSQQQWMQSFQHQHDPGQVDWAALAQAWIAQKESTGTPQHSVQPNGQDIPGLDSAPPPSNHGSFQGDSAFGRIWQPEWGMHSQPPPPPPPPDQAWIPPGSGPMEVVTPNEDSNSQDSVEFNTEAHRGVFPQNSHGYGAQPDSYAMAPVAMNQFDYQHGAASTFTPTPSSTGFPSPYWQGPPQNRRDPRPPGFRDRPRSPVQLPVKPETPAPLDAVKRRTLPAWIREGLEKMDREKQKKMERERMEKERAEMAKDDPKKNDVDEDGDGPRLPRKSKFDSDDEGNDHEDDEKISVKKEFPVKSPSPPAEDSEPEMSEDLKEELLMGLTKTLLTEILLTVTNEEILHVARDTRRKATRAPAKQLAQSSALASLTGLSGIGDYGSDESEEEDERSVRGSESSDTDDEELHHRIREKQDAFRRKEREMQMLQEKQAQEALLARGKKVSLATSPHSRSSSRLVICGDKTSTLQVSHRVALLLSNLRRDVQMSRNKTKTCRLKFSCDVGHF
uniref:PNN-interacting serine/arginine-rich protein n=1 Tax=Nothobranchius furzeri TaxID=105023 RepID=A0A8C6MJS6_NOTFU